MAKGTTRWRGALIGAFVGAVVVGAMSVQRAMNQGQSVEEQVAETAALLREQLPQSVDGVTTWTDVTAEGTTLTYHYVLAGPAADYAGAPVAEVIGPDLLAGVCGNADMVRGLGAGVRYVYSYAASDGAAVGEFAVEPGDC